MSFDTIGVLGSIATRLKKQGISKPTPIQESVIPKLLGGCDALIKSGTGTGKTLAYLIPFLQKKENSPLSQDAALILVPTRELALQVTKMAEMIVNDEKAIVTIYGGVESKKQLSKLKHKVSVIVATPGRLLDYIDSDSINLKNISYFVVDEVDQMLLLGFLQDVEKIRFSLPTDLQSVCVSATIDAKVKKMAYKLMKDPVSVSFENDIDILKRISHNVIFVSDRWKMPAILETLHDKQPFMAIIFCRTIRRAEKLEAEMCFLKMNCALLHGDLSQNVRNRIIKQFRDGDIQYLITTDLASRGLDISGVTHVFNYDMPDSIDMYIHRVGRTARMGKDGDAFSYVTPKDQELLQVLKQDLSIKVIEGTFERSDDFVDRTHQNNRN